FYFYFVTYLEHNSADSYLHEEPDGVKQQQVVKLIPPPQPTKQPPSQTPQKYDVKKKVVDSMDVTANQTDEPPWIRLSRKLCTKFIEEHIEYPLITPDQSVEKINLIEPNGDVRIIEKIGKPKCRNSKMRRESEPEWVSLSRKLRAKFIESHIESGVESKFGLNRTYIGIGIPLYSRLVDVPTLHERLGVGK
ncbi:hypothetical protein AVEN_114826-1, partial [Araneus ventricosus]